MEKQAGEIKKWDQIIGGKEKFSLGISVLLHYKDLLFLLVKRDLKAFYKQTVLGPFWLVLQPVITTLTFSVIFGRLAGLSTDGLPMFLFYFSGFYLWSFFAECLTKTSDTFILNSDLFGKVFFPRLIMPLSILITNSVKLIVNFLLFLSVLIYFKVNNSPIEIQFHLLWLFPILIIILAFIGFAFGLIISSMTTKYRDLRFMIQFGVQLMMYLSPVVYPLSITKGTIREVILLNPVTSIIEANKFIFLGKGEFMWGGLVYSFGLMLVLLFIGLFVFRKVERSFIDTV